MKMKQNRLSMKQVSAYADSIGYKLQSSYSYYEVWDMRSRLFTGTLRECYIYLQGAPTLEHLRLLLALAPESKRYGILRQIEGLDPECNKH